MTDGDVEAHLHREIGSADPWRLQSNPFEQARYRAMLGLLASGAPFARALEIGCAGGAFTERLSPACMDLVVLDLLPAALERAKERLLGEDRVTWVAGDVVGHEDPDGFDLVVLAEVLYYVRDPQRFRRAVRDTARLLRPGGLLVFCSARDALSRRWGLGGGAESALRLFERELREIARVPVTGAEPDEDCLIVGYRRP
jgi:2-polyprenyl-3-methyl-5-hydroxy-6-metoxy-1,4-benzoquinol methylase